MCVCLHRCHDASPLSRDTWRYEGGGTARKHMVDLQAASGVCRPAQSPCLLPVHGSTLARRVTGRRHRSPSHEKENVRDNHPALQRGCRHSVWVQAERSPAQQSPRKIGRALGCPLYYTCQLQLGFLPHAEDGHSPSLPPELPCSL